MGMSLSMRWQRCLLVPHPHARLPSGRRAALLAGLRRACALLAAFSLTHLRRHVGAPCVMGHQSPPCTQPSAFLFLQLETESRGLGLTLQVRKQMLKVAKCLADGGPERFAKWNSPQRPERPAQISYNEILVSVCYHSFMTQTNAVSARPCRKLMIYKS